MRNFIFFVITSVLLGSNSLAQNPDLPDETIVVDFKNIKKEYTATVNYKQTFNIQINNLNRNIYKVDGVKTETDFNTTLPSALTGIKLPAYLFTNLPAKSNVESLPVANDRKSSAIILEKIKENLSNINIRAKKLDDATFLYNDLLHLSKNCQDDQSIITTSALEKSNKYLTGSTSFGSITPQQMQINLSDSLYKLRPFVEEDLSRVGTLIEQYEVSASEELSDINSDAIKQLQENKRAINTNLTVSQKNKALVLITKYEQIINGFSGTKSFLNSTIEQLKQNQAKAQSTVEDMRNFEKEDKIYALLKLFNLLVNPSTFGYTSELITAKADEISYLLTIEPTELNTCGINGKKTIQVKVKVNKGLKIDFSTGIFLNSGSDDFLGRTYYYENIDMDSRKIVAADRGSRFLLSVGALMHFYQRSAANIKVGGSIGVSTTAAITDLLLHIGPSLFFGNKNRVIISIGVTLKTSSILDQKLVLGTAYTKLKSPDSIPTVSIFPTVGSFFSLTYNFTKLSQSK